MTVQDAQHLLPLHLGVLAVRPQGFSRASARDDFSKETTGPG